MCRIAVGTCVDAGTTLDACHLPPATQARMRSRFHVSPPLYPSLLQVEKWQFQVWPDSKCLKREAAPGSVKRTGLCQDCRLQAVTWGNQTVTVVAYPSLSAQRLYNILCCQRRPPWKLTANERVFLLDTQIRCHRSRSWSFYLALVRWPKRRQPQCPRTLWGLISGRLLTGPAALRQI